MREPIKELNKEIEFQKNKKNINAPQINNNNNQINETPSFLDEINASLIKLVELIKSIPQMKELKI